MSSQDHRNESTPSLAPKLQTIEASWETKSANRSAFQNSSKSENFRESLSRRFNLKAPLIVRSNAIIDALGLDSLPAEIYAKLATIVHRAGGAVLASVEDLAMVPLREIPVRIEPINGSSMPNVDALMSADAIELQLGDWTPRTRRSTSVASLRSLQMNWPLDVPDLLRLAKKIELIRSLVHDSVPVGVAVPMGDASATGIFGFHWLSEIDIDFVTIRSATACLGIQHPAQSYFPCDPIELTKCVRELFDRPGKNRVAIAIDHPWVDGYHAAKAVLAGATLVGADGYLARFVPTVAESTNVSSVDSLASGLLGRNALQSTLSQTPSISRILQKLDLDLALSTFTDQLRSALEYSL